MTISTRLQLRDGVKADVTTCLSLDHSYETDYVWQLQIHGDNASRTIALQQDRLPRELELQYPKSQRRLEAALAPEHAFIVAADTSQSLIFGYLVLASDHMMQAGYIRDLVVDRPYRRAGIATKLLRVARQWATAHELNIMYAETQNVNYPAIKLYQRGGFSFCGFNDRYFQNQDIAIFFSLPLN